MSCAMSMSRPRSIFEVFPVELLAMIKAEIPISDLRTHVCLYKAALRFADLYEDDDEEDEFWQASCILSGIGFIEDEDAWTTWKSVAFECLDEDGFCKHPQCGGARLEANTRGMVKFMNLSAKPTMQELQEAILQCKNVEWVNHSPLLKHFCFGSPMARREHGHFHHLEVEEDTYLDHPDIKEDDPPEYQWKLHPIARRSFATFPVAKALHVFKPIADFGGDVENLYGVTMDDVVTRLHESIDRDVTRAFPGGRNVVEVLQHLKTVRDVLYFFRPDGMEFDSWDDFEEEELEPCAYFGLQFRAARLLETDNASDRPRPLYSCPQ
ncbi:unnamed protein product [Somion occarium]|uniref:F-box domain-containing protein n=1 Tax=Somion occarium TaxID=3059160 RepID=A0ABP1DK71_9APHY